MYNVLVDDGCCGPFVMRQTKALPVLSEKVVVRERVGEWGAPQSPLWVGGGHLKAN